MNFNKALNILYIVLLVAGGITAYISSYLSHTDAPMTYNRLVLTFSSTVLVLSALILRVTVIIYKEWIRK